MIYFDFVSKCKRIVVVNLVECKNNVKREKWLKGQH